jgi:hypothetical protein
MDSESELWLTMRRTPTSSHIGTTTGGGELPDRSRQGAPVDAVYKSLPATDAWRSVARVRQQRWEIQDAAGQIKLPRAHCCSQSMPGDH